MPTVILSLIVLLCSSAVAVLLTPLEWLGGLHLPTWLALSGLFGFVAWCIGE
jgi:hypothetical protein